MGRAAGMWGEFLLHVGKTDEAVQQIATSCQLAEEVAAADPENAEYQRDLGVALYRQGVVLQVRGDSSAADSFEKCRVIRQRLVDLSQASEKRRRELMLVLAHTDKFAEAARLAHEFRQMEKLDNEVLLDIARGLSQCSLAATADDQRQAFREEAIEALQAAVASGYRDYALLAQDAVLQPLQEDNAFRQLLAPSKSGSSPAAKH
jgi:hypothetical protein